MQLKELHRSVSIAVLIVCLGGAANAAEWGDLKIRFVYDGAAPAAKKLVPNKDVQVCGKHDISDETLVVNSANNGIRDVIGFVNLGRGKKLSAIHPDYEKTAKDNVVLDNKGCIFVPHAMVLRTTQTLLVKNSDSVGHNTNVTALSNTPQNLLIPAGGEVKMKFPSEERVVLPASCNIHPWMKSNIAIIGHPYGAVSDKDGVLTIKNLPVGKWRFKFWQEKSGNIDAGKLNGKSFKWRGGRNEFEIKAGMNDLGEVKIASVFSR